MIASLPMYERTENATAHDRFWALTRKALRAEGIAAPDALTRGADVWTVWQDPALVLSQTCGMPLRTRLRDRVTLLATPDYGLKDTAPGYYYSVLVAHPDAPDDLAGFRGKTMAYNDALSQSGWAAPQLAAAKLGFRFTRHRLSGSHRQSVADVAAGRADIAAIDALSWRTILAHDAAASRVRVIGHTDATPGLPYIAGPGTDPAPHVRALGAAIAAIAAIAAPGSDDRAALGLTGLVRIPLAVYCALATPPGPGQTTADTREYMA